MKSQLYRALDRKYLTEKVFQELYALADLVAAKISTLTKYLNKCEYKGPKFKDRGSHEKEVIIIPLSDIDFPDQVEHENSNPGNDSTTENSKPKTENGEPKTENIQQKTENRKP